jgi:hemoglobin/transferrin/lactoferrin receptor protein
MAFRGRTTRAFLLGVSIVSIGGLISQVALAQTATQGDVQPQKPKPIKKKRAAAAVPAQVANANAQAPRSGQSLDEITVTASKTQERAIDALAPVSIVTQEQIQLQQPNRLSQLFYNIPGVWMQDRGDDPSTARARIISAPATTRMARSSWSPN